MKNQDCSEEDELIRVYTNQIDLVERFVLAGEDKGEACLLFTLSDIDNRTPEQEKKFRELLKKFRKSKNTDVRFTAELLGQ